MALLPLETDYVSMTPEAFQAIANHRGTIEVGHVRFAEGTRSWQTEDGDEIARGFGEWPEIVYYVVPGERLAPNTVLRADGPYGKATTLRVVTSLEEVGLVLKHFGYEHFQPDRELRSFQSPAETVAELDDFEAWVRRQPGENVSPCFSWHQPLCIWKGWGEGGNTLDTMGYWRGKGQLLPHWQQCFLHDCLKYGDRHAWYTKAWTLRRIAHYRQWATNEMERDGRTGRSQR